MHVAFIILAHQNPAVMGRLIGRLLGHDDTSIFLHYDAKSRHQELNYLLERFNCFNMRLKAVDRVSISWGEWSIVQATLKSLEAIEKSGLNPDYVHLMSGADYPIKPVSLFIEFLKSNQGLEYIESYDADRYRWVTDGYQEERYRLWHFINWKKHPLFFDLNISVQKKLGIQRRPPSNHKIHLGSQWWTLTWHSCKKILDLSRQRQIQKFYKYTWVPDEIFFQTLIRQVARKENITNYPLTLYQFSEYGTPIVYYNGHEKYLCKQNFFFARKLSPFADQLRQKLDNYCDNSFKSMQFNKKTIGKKTSDYLYHKLKYGYGLFGKRRIGKIKDEWFSDLEWNTRPYIMIWASGAHVLNYASLIFQLFDGITTHGRLFKRESIEFSGGAKNYAGFSESDIELRDFNTRNFLARVINEEQMNICSFQLCPDDTGIIGEVVAHDRNSLIIVLMNTSIYEWYFEYKAGEISADPTLIYRFLKNKTDKELEFLKILETAKAKFIPINMDSIIKGEQELTDQLITISNSLSIKIRDNDIKSYSELLRCSIDMNILKKTKAINQYIHRNNIVK